MVNSVPPLGILALQGDFAEHFALLQKWHIPSIPVRTVAELEAVSGLIIPGGESTTLRSLMKLTGIWNSLLEKKSQSFPVFGTCAGIILLAQKILGYRDEESLGYLPIVVERNAYGRQKDSFIQKIWVNVFEGEEMGAVFIRAPIIRQIFPGVAVLAQTGEQPILVRKGFSLGSTFHPELSGSPLIHKYFYEMVNRWWTEKATGS